MSLPMLSSKHHVGTTTIHRNFKKYNLPCRSHSEKSRLYTCNYEYFKHIDSEDKAYFLGIMFSDGYISGNAFGIAIKDEDVDVIEKLNYYMDSTYPINYYTNNGYGEKYKNKTKYARLLIRSETAVACLIDNGVIYRKSNILKPPKINRELIRHFIRGFMDGDGSIYECAGSATVSFTGTFDMLSYIGDYFVEEGIIKQYVLYKEHDSLITKSLKIGGNIQSRNLLNHLYQNAHVYMNRKHDIYLKLQQSRLGQ